MLRRIAPLLLALPFAACLGERPPDTATAGAESDGESRYAVDIRWTSYGIPHVTAKDWGSLGYGFAYATATDGVCVFSREVATANGTLSADLGASEQRFASDVFHRVLLTDERIRRHREALSADDRAFNAGFVAGYNRFLDDHAGRLPASCSGEDWVRPLAEGDLDRLLLAFGIRYGVGLFKEDIAAAAPPGGEPAAGAPFEVPAMPGIGSNAIALGGSLTASGRGLLLGNPHYPWHGASRFHMIHVRIPEVVDAMGASLLGGTFIGIGFNQDIAWTHTVSTAKRYTLYELEINPDDPMQYRHGEQFLDVEPRTVRVPMERDNGATVTQEHTVYMTHYGPLLVNDALPWNAEKAYAVRDAVLDVDTAPASYRGLQTARSVADVEAAISRQGVYFVNTIAADRHGNAFYADVSATPNLDAATLERCRLRPAGIPAHVVVLDGADPGCAWQDDPESEVPGNMPAEDMPRATSTDYFTNSNDSYWLANPQRPLEGYSPIIGDERTARSLRTRAGLTYLREAIDEHGSLTPSDLQQILFSHRHYGGELFLSEVLTLCKDAADDIARACDALTVWRRSAATDSRGTQVWTEFWANARRVPDRFEVSFDVDDPVGTPRGLALDDPEVRAAFVDALAAAQAKLENAGIDLDAPWGEVQFAERNGRRIPIPGARGWHGVFSFIDAAFTEGKGYTPIETGNSYIQVIGWNEDGTLDARGLLTYSQSPEPDSPHYADQTELYSRGEWIDLPFTEEEILADPNLETVTLRE